MCVELLLLCGGCVVGLLKVGCMREIDKADWPIFFSGWG